MKKTKKKKRSSAFDRLVKRLAKRLIISPDEPTVDQAIESFYVYNEKTGYHEPIKKV